MDAKSKEPTRPIGEAQPAGDGTLRAKSVMSPKACKVRARLEVPSTTIMPVIVVPGIMGTNLRASTAKGAPANAVLKPGDVAWRAPNDAQEALLQAAAWKRHNPAGRQRRLAPATLEVDPDGAIPLPREMSLLGITAEHVRRRGWGEIHWASYGALLWELHVHFRSFIQTFDKQNNPAATWASLNRYDRGLWTATKARAVEPLSVAELTQLAGRSYPIYAFGYNWLRSNGESADRLAARIDAIIASWNQSGCRCEQVILVTHSMGGLVSRACAKAIPDKIAGIVHGCMPALGAPVCYRRIACGMETSSPSNGKVDDIVMDKISDIVGKTAAETTPTMAFAPGALELLPTHLYPRPWLFIARENEGNRWEDLMSLPEEDPYAFYRDFTAWYRAIDPALADPAGLHRGSVVPDIARALREAERFHKTVLGEYYHPNTYAFYGADPAKRSYGTFRWVGDPGRLALLSQLQQAEYASSTFQGGRNVVLPDGRTLFFRPAHQDARGDGTVPEQSGDGAAKSVKAAFRTVGYSHQGSFADEAMRRLTIHLTARVASDA